MRTHLLLNGLMILALLLTPVHEIPVSGFTAADFQSLAPAVLVAAEDPQANADSSQPAISTDGRFVAFMSYASDLADQDHNGKADIFVRDMLNDQIELISTASDGAQGDGDSSDPALSADGRFVAFVSASTNLAPGDSNGFTDIFVHDRQTGITERVSVTSTGLQANGASSDPVISADGRFVAFVSLAFNLAQGDTNGQSNIFLRDRQAALTESISVAPDGAMGSGGSDYPSISADGRYVAFSSWATNLVPGFVLCGKEVYLRDRQNAVTEPITVLPDGSMKGACGISWQTFLSPDGRYVVFTASNASLTPEKPFLGWNVFLRDRQAGMTELISVPLDGVLTSYSGSVALGLSDDGRFVLFGSGRDSLTLDDHNLAYDFFVHDRQNSLTERIVVGEPIAFYVEAINTFAAISGDGRWIALNTRASGLTAGDTNGYMDVFVRDLQSSLIRRISMAPGLWLMATPAFVPADGSSLSKIALLNGPTGHEIQVLSSRGNLDGIYPPTGTIAMDGSYTTVLHSRQTGEAEITVKDLTSGEMLPLTIQVTFTPPQWGATRFISVDAHGVQGNFSSSQASISMDGRYVAFESQAQNLAPDSEFSNDIFVRDLQLGANSLISVLSEGILAVPNIPALPEISGDGRYVAFISESGGVNVFLRDTLNAVTERISLSSEGAEAMYPTSCWEFLRWEDYRPAVSTDGRFVAFASCAANLAPDQPDEHLDIFLRDRQTGTTERIPVGEEGPGWYWLSFSPSISADGRYVLFSAIRCFPGTDDRGHVIYNCMPANFPTNLYLHDRQSGVTEPLLSTQANTSPMFVSFTPGQISPDGRFILFSVDASLLPADTNGWSDAYLLDRTTGELEIVSRAAGGALGNADSTATSFSQDGRYIVFTSYADNLVAGDTNQLADVFVRDRQTNVTERVSISSNAIQGDSQSGDGQISSDGRYVAFTSNATHLVPGDTNGFSDVFVRERCPDGSCVPAEFRSNFILSLLIRGPLFTNQAQAFLSQRNACVTTHPSLSGRPTTFGKTACGPRPRE